MANSLIEVTGLDELIARMKKYPLELTKGMAATMAASLIVLWENVPPYPSPPQDSKYDRTGTLGRSLGSSTEGGAGGGEPSVYTIRKLGEGYEGKFGTNLDYAPYVIGDGTQSGKNSHWWTMRAIADKAGEKVNKLWQALGDKMAAFLEGKVG